MQWDLQLHQPCHLWELELHQPYHLLLPHLQLELVVWKQNSILLQVLPLRHFSGTPLQQEEELHMDTCFHRDHHACSQVRAFHLHEVVHVVLSGNSNGRVMVVGLNTKGGGG